MNIKLPYQHIRHVLYSNRSMSRWKRHRENDTHVCLLFGHLNREARLWAKIIYTCLIHETHLTEVTRDRVCLIYALMRNDVNVNMGPVIFSAMRKMQFQGTHRYGFGGLLTRFLQEHGVEEEDVDYRPAVNTRPLDLSRTKGSVPYGTTLTMPERQALNNEITTLMYELQIL